MLVISSGTPPADPAKNIPPVSKFFLCGLAPMCLSSHYEYSLAEELVNNAASSAPEVDEGHLFIQIDQWKTKYIEILEKYTELLSLTSGDGIEDHCPL